MEPDLGLGRHPAAGDNRRVLVPGATSVVAFPLLTRPVSEGFHGTAISRQRLAQGGAPAGVIWRVGDLGRGFQPGKDSAVVFHLAILWLLPSLVGPLARRGLRRLVAFGSTSRFGRERSRDADDRELAAPLTRAETELDRTARDLDVTWTILRPTLVLLRPATEDRPYNLPGGETLTFCEMAERITLAVLAKRRVVRLPLPVLRGLMLAVSRLPSLRHLDPEMANRVNEDLVFDASDARRDSGRDPGPFEPSTSASSC